MAIVLYLLNAQNQWVIIKKCHFLFFINIIKVGLLSKDNSDNGN